MYNYSLACVFNESSKIVPPKLLHTNFDDLWLGSCSGDLAKVCVDSVHGLV